jgi:hypothetical protein
VSGTIDINRVAATAIETVLGEDRPKHRSTSSARAVVAGAAVATAALAARRSLVSPSRVLRRGEAVLSSFVDIEGMRHALHDRLADAGLVDAEDEEPEESDADWEEDEEDEESGEPAADEDEDWDEEDDEGGDAGSDDDDYDWKQAESEWDEDEDDDEDEAGVDGSGGEPHPAERPPKPPRRGARQRHPGGRER